MHIFTTERARVMLGAIGIGALVALTACAPTPQTSSPPTPSPSQTTAAPEPYAGPIVFVGDELDAFALTPEEIVGLVPEATEVGEPSPVLEQVSDGGGEPADPAICEALYAEQSLGTVGARTVEWKVPADPRYGFGRLHVLQFADEAQAQARMDQLLQAAQQCAAFTKGGPVTFDAVIPEASGDVRAFAGTLVDRGLGWQTFDAFAATGNVIVQLWQPFTGDRTFDAEAAALLLQTRAEEARAGLIDELTENPPVAETDPSGDPGAVWSEWQIGVGGVGPLRLGDSVDAALAAVGEDAQIVEPEYNGGPWRLIAPQDAGSILVQPVEAGDTVQSITIGNDRSGADAVNDGAALPHRGDIRLGAAVADAMAAYPGGTVVDVSSSGDDYYAVTTRDGQVFRFQADRDVVEEGSTIVGITVEDATARKGAVFG
ncbi:hypothetical protein [Microbacterium sp. WCS2018Hpa-9]|uniref:hypothetical protein n=1 Tax=Microbacterium sp. WCS2018Hpa-9 TaxID=3073635 RepID=UPI00288C389B|nr:hypothetical protein [Microbacterium sp. WCS2018Hpa-9]